MARIVTPESEEFKELQKWNQPYVHQEYPRMLYRARRRPDGKVSVAEANDEAWTAQCQLIVKSEDEYLKAKGQGWCDTQPQALERFEKEAQGVAETTAHRHFEDKRLSEKAQKEAAAADEATSEQVPAVPEKPKVKRRF